MKRYVPNHKIFQVLFHNLFKLCLCQALIIETNLIFFYVDFNMPGLLGFGWKIILKFSHETRPSRLIKDAYKRIYKFVSIMKVVYPEDSTRKPFIHVIVNKLGKGPI